MGSIPETPSFLDASIDERQYYPARHQDQPYVRRTDGEPPIQRSTPILIIGGGPVGMYEALMLSHHGQPCMLAEQYPTTTIYPKMEFTNGRSMEMLRQMGIADQLRGLGVPEEYDLDEVITTGLGKEGRKIATWKRESPLELWRKIREENDGSWEREPYVRCTQTIVEEWLKSLVLQKESVESHWGWKFVELEENEDGVESLFFHTETGQEMKVQSRYVIGCDGGGSRVRKCAGLESQRKALDLHVIFVHLRSTDRDLMFSQGHYWHANLLHGAIIVNQDEKDTFTIHTIVPPGVDLSSMKTSELVNRAVGGMHGPVDVRIDELLARGEWASKVAVADNFRSKAGRVFLAGDAAHQLSPVGGHGLNSGMGDAWDLSWKLSAVVKGWGGEALLQSYDIERRPVAFNNLKMVEKGTYEVFLPMIASATSHGIDLLSAGTAEGESARKVLEEEIERGHWLHNQYGTSMGFRYNDSPVIVHDKEGSEPEYSVTKYVPSSWPGARAPQVLLAESETSVFDLFIPGFNVVDFTEDARFSGVFCAAGKALGIPIYSINLPKERHLRRVWERDAVLVRPDGHIGWRLPQASDAMSSEEAAEVLKLLSGNR